MIALQLVLLQGEAYRVPVGWEARNTIRGKDNDTDERESTTQQKTKHKY